MPYVPNSQFEKDVQDVLWSACNSDIGYWISPETIKAITLDMRDANRDTAMDEVYEARCNRILNEIELNNQY